ncbi:hypothetical protein TWF679_006641 [Orbilia oligospora]|uniref:Yeast cell wall synthesis Kre9/Knh1-like N-terminal domain-containing protein n=1 Tax=Orbilia oligospora TaxID=2813651 RepID=A0A8H8V997_ORBOL|nr:hypothetical protein TWF679_006641 [Orbilia oligospora]
MNLKPLFTLLNLYIIILKHAEAQFPISGNVILTPDRDTTLTAGGMIEIFWANTVGANVTIVLLDGATNQFEQILTLARNIENTGLFSWYIREDLPPSETYVIRISYDNNPNNYSYSERFKVVRYEPPDGIRTSRSSVPPLTRTISTRTTSTRTSSSNTPTSTDSSLPPSQSASSGPSIGVIIGAVIGGLALIIAGCLVAFWVVTRERRIRAATAAAGGEGAATARRVLPPPDPNNQSIWEGGNVVSYNVKNETVDIFPGQADPAIGAGGAVTSGQFR